MEPAATPGARLASLVLLGLIPVISLVFHRDDPRAIGLGLAGLGRSALEVGAATLAGALLIWAMAAGMGWRLGLTHHEPLLLPGYLVWGFLQQVALQAFVHRRLRRALGRPGLAEVAAALLFGSLHLPNPILAPAATLGGWVWCRLYSRSPSLWTLAASHAVLAALVLWVVPPAWVHNLKVGPGYWSWH